MRVLHGTRDSIVPMWCSEKFVETYGSKRAELVVVEGENHTISRKRKEVVASVVQFFKDLYRL